MKQFIKNHSLSIALALLFLASWALQFFFQLGLTANEAMQHGQHFEWKEFFTEYGKDTFENWQSEFLQVWFFVVLSKHFIHKDSPQSRDGDDEMKAQLDRIEAKLSE